MKKTLILTATFIAVSASMSAVAGNLSPQLELRHGVKQLVVDGKLFLILAGELHNSTASSAAWMKTIWPQLAQRNFNSSRIEIISQNGEWLPGRWLNGDEAGHNIRSNPGDSGIYMGSFGVYGYSNFQRN